MDTAVALIQICVGKATYRYLPGLRKNCKRFKENETKQPNKTQVLAS